MIRTDSLDAVIAKHVKCKMSKKKRINIVSSKTKVPAIASKFPPRDERYGEEKSIETIILSVRLLRQKI